MRAEIQLKIPIILGVASLVFAVLLFALSVSGALWTQQATPVTDPGMLSTVMVFILFGIGGLMVHRLRVQQAP